MTTREKARAYYEGDSDLYATRGWLDHDDIEGIVIDAFTAGAESKELTWQDVQKIVNIADEIVIDFQDNHSVLVDDKAYFTEMLRRFKEETCNSDKDLQGFDAGYLQSKIDAHTKYMQEHGITSEQQLATLDEMRGEKSEIPVNPWHKTSEELPKDDSEVLVCWETANHERKYTEIAMFFRNADCPDDWWFEDEDGQRITYKAKWWMHIPELPKD